MSVVQLGYVGFGVTDLDAWSRFLTEGLGLMAGEASVAGPRFRTDAQAWRIALEPSQADDLAYAGFEVADAAALDEMRRRLLDSGVAAADGDPALLAERGVMGLITCLDPEGLRVEIFYGPSERNEAPFASPAGVSGFVTAGQGLGHIVLKSQRMDETRAFWRDLLGFRLSDVIQMRPAPDRVITLEFYHCNGRHHTLALGPMAGTQRLHHFMLQVPSLDEVGFAMERMDTVGAPIAITLGRHTNDHMVSFYARTPSGFEVEYGYGAIEIDDATWRVVRHDKTSSWGHKRLVAHK